MNITGGNIRRFITCLDVVGTEYFHLSADVTLSDLQHFGVQTADGTFGSVELFILNALDTSRVHVSGGSMSSLYAYDSSHVDISGGDINLIIAENTSTVVIREKEVVLGHGLSLDDNDLIGTGQLSGQWMDGTPWMTRIRINNPTATILLIPEPATVLLLGLGSFVLRRKHRK